MSSPGSFGSPGTDGGNGSDISETTESEDYDNDDKVKAKNKARKRATRKAEQAKLQKQEEKEEAKRTKEKAKADAKAAKEIAAMEAKEKKLRAKGSKVKSPAEKKEKGSAKGPRKAGGGGSKKQAVQARQQEALDTCVGLMARAKEENQAANTAEAVALFSQAAQLLEKLIGEGCKDESAASHLRKCQKFVVKASEHLSAEELSAAKQRYTRDGTGEPEPEPELESGGLTLEPKEDSQSEAEGEGSPRVNSPRRLQKRVAPAAKDDGISQLLRQAFPCCVGRDGRAPGHGESCMRVSRNDMHRVVFTVGLRCDLCRQGQGRRAGRGRRRK